MTAAPVCHVAPESSVTTQPTGALLPVIPQATDLTSALNAIGAIRQTLMQMNNQLRNQSNNSNRGGGQGGSGGGGSAGVSGQKKPKMGRWNEIPDERVVQTVRIFNPKDKEQYVDVQRINALTFQDTVTGESFYWYRGNTGNQAQ